MELKTYFAQDASGNIMPGATVTVYEAGTTTLATGLQDESGSPLANPFTADSSAAVVFAAPDGEYDVKCSGASRTVTIRAQLFDGGAFKADLASTAAGKGAGLVGFKQSGTGAVGRTVDDKLREVVSVKDFGAVGDGVTNNLAAIAACIAAAAGKTILVPVDPSSGDYAITSGTLTIPAGQRFEYEANAKIYAAGGTISDSGYHASLLGSRGSGSATKGLNIELLGGNTGSATGVATYFNNLKIRGDQLDGEAGGGTKVNGLTVDHAFGGTNTKGGRHGVEVSLTQTSVTNSNSTDRNYVGLSAHVQSSVGDGGTAGPVYKGSYFSLEALTILSGTAAYATNCTGILAQVSISDGASAKNREAIQITSKGTTRGLVKDAAISLSCGVAETTFKYGFYFNDANGQIPLGTDSALIKVSPSGDIDTVIDVEQVTMNNLFRTTESAFSDSNLRMRKASSAITLGAQGTTNTPNITFFSGSTSAPAWDTRLTASGGNGTNGNGNLTISAGVLTVSGILRPSSDNTQALGGASNKWSVVYAGTGTINTSDAREKQQVRPLTEAERAVAIRLKSLVRAFKFNDAVEAKGDGARIHFGVIAQEVKVAFEAEGLSAEHYAILCYDEWPEQVEVTTDEGEVVTPSRAAGNRYGVRYEELLAFIIAAI